MEAMGGAATSLLEGYYLKAWVLGLLGCTVVLEARRASALQPDLGGGAGGGEKIAQRDTRRSDPA